MSPSSLPNAIASSNPTPIAPIPGAPRGGPAESFASSLQRAQLSPPPAAAPAPAPKAPAAPSASSSPKPSQSPSPSSDSAEPAGPPAESAGPLSEPASAPAQGASERAPGEEADGEKESLGLNPALAFLLGAQTLATARGKTAEAGSEGVSAGGSGARGPAQGLAGLALERLDDPAGPGLAPAAGAGALAAGGFEEAMGAMEALLAKGAKEPAASASPAEEATLEAAEGALSAALAAGASQASAAAAPAGPSELSSSPIPLTQGAQAFADHSASVLTRMGAAGATEAIVRVSPEALGPIRIDISMSGDSSKAMSVSFSAADPQTTDLIQSQLAQLSDAMGALGWQLQEVKATTDASLGQDQSQGQFAGSHPDGSGGRRGPEAREGAWREQGGSDFGRALNGEWSDSSAAFNSPPPGRDPRRLFDFYA